MPVRPSYPGVYISETASGVRSIPGVPTSVTAFLGRFRHGPINEPVSASNFGEFARRFGGLWAPSPASYAVDDFFANGGSQAIIVRLFRPRDANDDGVATLAVGNLSLVAADPGEWGNGLSAVVSYPADAKAVEDIAVQYGLAATDLFDLDRHRRLDQSARGVLQCHGECRWRRPPSRPRARSWIRPRPRGAEWRVSGNCPMSGRQKTPPAMARAVMMVPCCPLPT